jgi:hypothetical protein
MHTNDDFILFINKSLTGEIQPEEQDLLNKWIAQSPENQQIEKDLRQIWQQIPPTATKTFTPNLDHDFAQVLGKIKQEEIPLRRSYLRPALLRVAAVFLLLIASVYTWQRLSSPAAEMQQIAALETEKQYQELPDGTKVWLRKGAHLQFPAFFSGKDREVQLDGEAFFEVHHDAAHPFKVMLANGGMVEVLGTSFDVHAASSDALQSVFVRTGKVRYMPKQKAPSKLLVAGNKAIYNPADETVQVVNMPSSNELAWQTGGLEFVNTPLNVVIDDLQQYFNVKIALKNQEMIHCPYTAPLTTHSVDKVLDGLAYVFHMKVEKDKNGGYILKGGNCDQAN